MATTVRACAPDIVALQEVGNRWSMGPTGDSTSELSALAGLPHHVHVPALVDGDHAYGHALLSSAPIEEVRIELLPRLNDEPRCLLTSRVGDLVVVTTHLSHLPDERPAQGQVLADRVLALVDAGDRVLVMGDLNQAVPVAWLDRLTARLLDADAVAARPTYPARAPTQRLDYLLTSAGSWRSVDVVEEVEASDHRPLTAVLDLEGSLD